MIEGKQNMETWMQMIITVVCSVIASSGFWTYAQKKVDRKDVTREMLLGLAHDRIIYLGLQYIDRGDWITQDEYENLNDYLYKPYGKMGGNGSANRIMKEVDKLRIIKSTYNYKEVYSDDKRKI